MKKILLPLLLIVFSLGLKAQTFYVTPTGSATGNGNAALATTWATATNDMQAAINAAATAAAAISPTATCQVWVAKGTYIPNRNASTGVITPPTLPASTMPARDNAFVIKNNVKIYGGFTGTGLMADGVTAETIGNRSLTTNISKLSGDFNGDDLITGLGSTLTITGNTENTYHVVISSGSVGAATLDGFTITGGNANLTTTLSVNLNTIVRNTGGGMVCFRSFPILTNLNIDGNTANSSGTAGFGGGLYYNINAAPPAGSTIAITKSFFSRNISYANGGGLYFSINASITGLNSTFTTCVFSGNKTIQTSTSSTGGGAGMDIQNGNSSVMTTVLTDCTFNDNSAGGGGGGFGNINGTGLNRITFVNSIFRNNKSPIGGAIQNGQGATTIKVSNSLLINNNATLGGGAIQVNGALEVTNCTLIGNKCDAANTGMAIYATTPAVFVINNSIIYYQLGYTGSDNLTKSSIATTPSSISNSVLQTASMPPPGPFTVPPYATTTAANAAKAAYYPATNCVLLTGSQDIKLDATTHVPMAGSPAINIGSKYFYENTYNFFTTPPSYQPNGNDLSTGKDLLGEPRGYDPTVNPIIDAGAYERQYHQQTIAPVANLIKTYGDPDFDPLATASSGLPVSYISSDPSSITVVNGKLKILKVPSTNPVTITASQPGENGPPGTFDPAPDVTFTVTVNPAVLTVKADKQSRPYNTANPPLTITYTGFVNNETEANLTSPVTATTIADTTSPVGNYDITVGGAASNNYTFNYVNDTLSVEKADQIITFVATDTKTYGEVPGYYTLGAVASSGLHIIYTSSNPNIAKIINDVLYIIGAGTVTITAEQPGDSNYNAAVTVTQELTINPASLTITAVNQSRAYGAADPSFTFTYEGFVNGDTVASLTTPPSATTTATATSPAGTSYPIDPTGAASANYTISYASGTLTIGQAELFVIAESKERIFNTPNPPLTFTYSGFVNGDTAASFTTPPTASTTATISSVKGQYDIVPSGAAIPNYVITYINGSLGVELAPQTITFASTATKMYGDSDYNPGATSSSGLMVTYTSSDDSVATIVNNKVHIVAAGTVTIIAHQEGTTDTYNAATAVAQILTVNKAVLTITAENKSRNFGTANPAFTVTYDGFVNSDSETSLTTLPSAASMADITSPVGNYDIIADGAAANNYSFNYVNGILTIDHADQTITFATTDTKIYGTADYDPGAISSSGLVVTYTSSDATVASIVNNQIHIVGVGTVIITANQSGDGNYNAAPSVTQTLTVTPATLTITAENKSRTYAAADPLFTFTYSGFVGSDNVASLTTLPTASTTATTTSAAGTNYPIIPTGATSANYTINYTNGNLAINQAELIIIADSKERAFNAPDPVFTFTYSGFVNGETQTSLTTLPTASTTANISSPKGQYPIIPSGATATNYNISYMNGSLGIDLAPQTITFNPIPAQTYGNTNYVLTATAPGGPVTYTSSDPTVATIDTTDPVSPKINIIGAGTVTITANQSGNSNYNAANPVTQTLTVNKAVLTIKAEDKSRNFGTVNPAFTVTYDGFVYTDNIGSLATLATAATTADVSSPVGTYDIVANGAASNNYTFNYALGTLTIGKADQTITFASADTKVYGVEDYNPGGTSSSGLKVTYTSTNPAVATIVNNQIHIVGAGTTTIIADQIDVNGNYNPAPSVSQTLTVNKVVLRITAEDKTREYGLANPIFTFTYNGFVGSDSVSSLTTPPTATTIAGTSSPVGSYVISVGSAVSDNYTFNYINGKLTIQDTTPPTVITQNITVQLDGTGKVIITPAQIDNGSSDNNLINTRSLDKAAFTCANIGTNTVTLTVTDLSGNVSSNTAIVTVENKVVPIVITKNITVQLDASANVTITPDQVNDGSMGTCGIASLVLDKTSFTCANVGANTVTLTLTDNNGNKASNTAIVTVEDKTNPTVLTRNIAVNLDSRGIAVFTEDQINNGSTDACGIASMSLDITSLNCNNIGDNTVVLTVTDVHGNLSSAPATVTVSNPLQASCNSINISQAITRNGDGINDTWMIYGIENYPKSKIHVYNRWGAEVFSAVGYKNDWNGTYKNEGPLPESGAYYYVIDLNGTGAADKTGWLYITK